VRTSDFPPSRIATTDIGKGLPQAAPRTELFPLKLCTGIFPSLTKLTVSSGQFDARIISLALPESTALEDCLEPRCTSPVSIASLNALFRSIYLPLAFFFRGLYIALTAPVPKWTGCPTIIFSATPTNTSVSPVSPACSK